LFEQIISKETDCLSYKNGQIGGILLKRVIALVKRLLKQSSCKIYLLRKGVVAEKEARVSAASQFWTI
jgi:hypothetical protein